MKDESLNNMFLLFFHLITSCINYVGLWNEQTEAKKQSRRRKFSRPSFRSVQAACQKSNSFVYVNTFKTCKSHDQFLDR